MKKITHTYQNLFRASVLAVAVAGVLSSGIAYSLEVNSGETPTISTDTNYPSAVTVKGGGQLTFNANIDIATSDKGVGIYGAGSSIIVNKNLTIGSNTGITGVEVGGVLGGNGTFNVSSTGKLIINTTNTSDFGGATYGVNTRYGGEANLGKGASITINSVTTGTGIRLDQGGSIAGQQSLVKAEDINIDITAVNAIGIIATGSSVANGSVELLGVNNKITMNSAKAIAIQAESGAVTSNTGKLMVKVGNKATNEKGTIQITSAGKGVVVGRDSEVNFYGDNNIINTTGNSGHAVSMESTGDGIFKLEGDGYQLTTSGQDAHVIKFGGGGSSAHNVSINSAGYSADNKLHAQGTGANVIDMNMGNGSFTLNQNGGSIKSDQGDILNISSGTANLTLDNVSATAGSSGLLINASKNISISGSTTILTAKNGSNLTGDSIGAVDTGGTIHNRVTINLEDNSVLTGSATLADVNLKSGSTWAGNATGKWVDRGMLDYDLATMNVGIDGSGTKWTGNAVEISKVSVTNNANWTGNATDTAVYVGNGASWTGASTFDTTRPFLTHATNRATVSNVTIDTGGTWNINNDSTVNNLTHAGTIAFVPPSTRALGGFNTLTVAGNYVGNGGTFMMNTRLGDDTSLTDQLVVLGNASGNANIAINNAGGAGGVITNAGIRLVSIAGTSTASFNLVNPVSVGIYQYGHLNQATDGNWYLSTRDGAGVTPPVTPPGPGVTPPGPGVTPPGPGVTPIWPGVYPGWAWGNDTTDYESIRSGYSSYLNNMTVATNMFLQSHQTRVDAQGIRGDHGVRSWAYISGSKTKHNMMKGNTEASNSGFVLRMGSDYGFNLGGDSQLLVGLMAGYGHTDADVRAKRLTFNGTKDKTSTDIDGYNVGLYGTWYGQNGEGVGPYVDAWFQYNWFNNEIGSRYYGNNKYDSKAWNASLEAGYTFKVYNSDHYSLYVEPQAQVIYSNYSADSVTDMGVRVSNYDANGVITRLGTRVFAKSNNIKPFAELNWWHDGTAGATADFRTNQGVKYNLSDDAPKNRFEVKAGVIGQINKNLSLQADVGMQMGKSSYRSYKGNLSISYAW